jgi:hypothetical protein
MVNANSQARKSAVAGTSTTNVVGAPGQGERPVRKTATPADATKGVYPRKEAGVSPTNLPSVDGDVAPLDVK